MNTPKLASLLALSTLLLACTDDGSDDYTAQTSSLRGRGGHDDAADGGSRSADAGEDRTDADGGNADAGDDRHHVASSSDGGISSAVGNAACTSDSQCGAGLECDDGRCKAHNDDSDDDSDDDSGDHDGGATSNSAAATVCVTDSQCGAGLECDDGQCNAHGGGKGKN
jgi:hypothetical protein